MFFLRLQPGRLPERVLERPDTGRPTRVRLTQDPLAGIRDAAACADAKIHMEAQGMPLVRQFDRAPRCHSGRQCHAEIVRPVFNISHAVPGLCGYQRVVDIPPFPILLVVDRLAVNSRHCCSVGAAEVLDSLLPLSRRLADQIGEAGSALCLENLVFPCGHR